MLKCKKCGVVLEAVLDKGTIHCECGADNKIVNGQVVDVEDDKTSGTWEAPGAVDSGKDAGEATSQETTEEKPNDEHYEGKDAEEETVELWFDNYKRYYEIKDVPATTEAFYQFTGLAPDSMIPRGRFKHLWEQFKSQGE